MERSFTILPNIDNINKLPEDVMVIWLDDTIGTSTDNQWFNCVGQLRQIVSHVEVFANVHECIGYVSSVGMERIFLIVAGTYGDDFDAKLFEEIMHDVSIYISTSEKISWNNNQSNIRSYFNNTNTLVNQVHEDYIVYATNRMPIIDPSSMKWVDFTMNRINPKIIRWKCVQLIMDLLRQMPCPRDQSKDRLVQFCKSQLNESQDELRQLAEFEQTYHPDNVIQWYTKTYFLYHLLNHCMRTNNVDAILDFSCVLNDIYDQLQNLRSQASCKTISYNTIYRGQLIGIEELQQLKLNIGGFISNNTTLSTSLEQAVAECFIVPECSLTDRVNVFFEISCDSASTVSKPYADVSTLSSFAPESEVLLMNSHIFRVDSCASTTNNTWLIKLTLCDDAHPIVQNSSDYFDIAILQLLEILPKISPKTNKANDRLLQWWRLYSANNTAEQTKIDQFEDSYRSDGAIRWYTKDSLLYHLLNAALRQDNIDMIIDFRYFIIDLYDQLTKSHLDYVRNFKEQTLTVYRGQKVSLKELRRFKHNIGKDFAIKSLFSASLSTSVALIYAELNESDKRQGLQSVLFQIDIDMTKLARSCKNHIFANIMNMSCFVNEEEVLFMVNTIFRIQSVKNWDNTFWLVKLTLLNQDDENSEEIRKMNRSLDVVTDLAFRCYGDNIWSFFKKRL